MREWFGSVRLSDSDGLAEVGRMAVMKPLLCALCLMLAGCGRPTAPTPPIGDPPAPAPPETPATTAAIVAAASLKYTPLPPDFNTWEFSSQLKNVGRSCATHIGGTVSTLAPDKTPVAIRAFALPDTVRLHPDETRDYTGCCFSTAEVSATTTYQVSFTFTAVACLPLVAF
jgi:hypothetical protein